MSFPYVEETKQGYRLTGSRVALASVVHAFLDGLSPETIATECFPTLTLEQVYGALTFYLAHRDEVDAQLRGDDVRQETERRLSRERNADLLSRLGRGRAAASS